ncbi:imm11 family protein [Microbacter margulisiae]|uniref:Immunity MXAN-0049 protein domain-containing protein n=1 Tax=Microbacter margulisiae TaxID=1350067 RepID=A0A7W5DRR1_9PORP|nr:DUF1629 domain-containing protein [Microbacter margulisiae]MBB3187867.1 hypothetical protein [Microbacter margulisiae]
MHYILKDSTDPKIIGNGFPQVFKFTKEYDPNGEKAIFELYKYRFEFPNFVPNLSGLKLAGYAKLTDFISNSFNTIIVSLKTKLLLEDFNLCPHRFYPCSLHGKKGREYDYYWLHIISDYSDYVDYKKSTFVEYDLFNKKGSVLVESKEDLLKKREELKIKDTENFWTIWGDKIVMQSNFEKRLDLFIVSLIDGNIYVSSRLYSEIIKNNLTGCNLIPANNIEFS